MPDPVWGGSWCIREVGTNQHSPNAALTNTTNGYNASGVHPQIIGAMNVGCWVGFGLRLGWDHVETGRVKVSSVASGTVLNVTTLHPAITNGQSLEFSTPASVNSPIVVTATAAAAANSATITVNSTVGITSGMRAGCYDDRVLDACADDMEDLGYMMAPRFMNGKYCASTSSPLRAPLVADGSVIHTDGNGDYHEPYNSSGVTNPVIIHAMTQFYRHVFDWADDRNATSPGLIPVIMAGTLPGMDYAELYFSGSGAGGDYLAALHMGSQTTNKNRMVSANSDLMDALVTASAGRYGLGFGISGLGGLSDVIAPGIAAHAATFGSFNTTVFVNANGWGIGQGGHTGEWGTTASNEAVYDANVWPKNVNRGVQDISPNGNTRTSAVWIDMFQNHCIGLQHADAVWCEIYAYNVRNGNGTGLGSDQANQAAWDTMVAQALAFNATIALGPQTVTAPNISRAATANAPVVLTDIFVDAPNIPQLAVANAPAVKMKVVAPNIPQLAVANAPDVGLAQVVEPDTIEQLAVANAPQVDHQTVTAPNISQLAVVNNGTVIKQSVVAPNIDRSAVANTPVVVNTVGGSVDAPNISRLAVANAPTQIKQRVTAPNISQAAVANAPVVGMGVTAPNIANLAVANAPTKINQRIEAPNISQAAVTNSPSVQIEGNDQFINADVIEQLAIARAPEVVQTEARPIRKRGRYVPTLELRGLFQRTIPRHIRGRYQRTIRKRGRAEADE